jgi:ADP-dependent NAD(P)H-hydrate dehydratase / NAD(P)H-hydrate epimerase
MPKLVTVEQMQSFEKQADKSGLTYQNMMQKAGSALAKEIQSIAHRYYADEVSIVGLIGPGNNGGDTLIALAKLAESYNGVTGYLLFNKKEQQELIDNVVSHGGNIVYGKDDIDYKIISELVNTSDILIDGVLGTGLKLPLHGEIKSFLEKIKNTIGKQEIPPIIIAVDCPSGVDNDTGETAEETVSADFTVCMAAVKKGLLKLPAYEHVGELIVVDIGFSKKNSDIYEIKNEVASNEVVNSYKIARPLDSHKGTFGTCMIVAGSSSYSGAALLAGTAAYRVGAGLVTMAVPSNLHGILAGHLPEATWILLPHQLGSISESAASVLLRFVNNADSMLIGCGLGLEDTTYEFMKTFLTNRTNNVIEQSRIGFLPVADQNNSGKKVPLPPLVIDADGLKLLTKIENWHKLLPENSILTPHPGEMQILTDLSIKDIQNDRLNIARKFAVEWNAIVVLKGAFTVIASPAGDTTTIPVATPALAHAGTGDVLAGMIAGFLAQGMESYKAAIAGAWYHSQAGLIAAEKLGCSDSVMAGDLLDAISESILYELI